MAASRLEEGPTTANGDSRAAQAFLDLWRTGAHNNHAHAALDSIISTCPLSGRLIHGQADDPGFGTLLSSDAWKRLSWVFGADALHGFLGQSARGMCLSLGFGADWLDEKLQTGKLFKLCIFPSSSVSATPATWDGVEALMKEHYPSIWPKIATHYARIRELSLEDIERTAGYDMQAANYTGRDHFTGESTCEHYMSLQRLLCIDNPTLVQVRQFLWDEIGLKKLFRGDAYTYDDDGSVGYLEYLARQTRLDSIKGAAIIDVVPI